MNPPVEACPELLELGSGIRWWLADACWREAARDASQAISEPGTLGPDRLLKAGLRRLVFTGGAPAAPGFVVKAFPLHGIRSRLKHRKYAGSEAHNLWQARQRSVPAPALHGWGRQRRRGTVRWNAVIIQHVGGRPFTDALAAAEDDSARAALITRCALLFRALFLAGCNHIDLRPEAVRLGSRAEEDALIDFQYCTFRDEPRLATIIAQAGHFAHWWEREHPEPGWVESWIDSLLDVLEVTPNERQQALSILAAHRARVPSIAERLRQ
jgi:hypothetical protein